MPFDDLSDKEPSRCCLGLLWKNKIHGVLLFEEELGQTHSELVVGVVDSVCLEIVVYYQLCVILWASDAPSIAGSWWLLFQ